MEKEILLKKTIAIQPRHMNEFLIKTVFKIAKLKYEKTCNEEDGIILSVNHIKDMKNIISKDSREIYFTLMLLANVVKPEKGDRIKFTPTLIIEKGIFGKLYDMISLFIPSDQLKDWEFEKDTTSFKRNGVIIEKNVEISAVIDEIKFNGIRYNCLCKID